MIDRIPTLTIPEKGRWRNAFEKRRLENMHTFGLRDPEASQEAVQHVSRLAWIVEQKKANKAAQMPLIDVGPAIKGKKRATAFTAEAK
jgi:hypothetical protein